MPRYEHDGYEIRTTEILTPDQVRDQVAAARAADAAEEADWDAPDPRSEAERRDAEQLAVKFAEPLGGA